MEITRRGDTECDADFEAIAAQAAQAWNEKRSAIEIEADDERDVRRGGTHAVRRKRKVQKEARRAAKGETALRALLILCSDITLKQKRAIRAKREESQGAK